MAPNSSHGTAIFFRLATQADVPVILGFIRALADYEKLSHEVVATEDILNRNLFGPKSYAECLIAEVGGEAAGFALFFHNFSTFLGKPGLYLEDLFVSPEYRHQGLGMGFFRALAKIALERDCGRMEWWVLDWNEPALKFYEKIGAESMSDWTVQRLNRNEIEAVVRTWNYFPKSSTPTFAAASRKSLSNVASGKPRRNASSR